MAPNKTALIQCQSNRTVLTHGDLVHMEGTAHIDLSRFETTEAINFKILPVMHM